MEIYERKFAHTHTLLQTLPNVIFSKKNFKVIYFLLLLIFYQNLFDFGNHNIFIIKSFFICFRVTHCEKIDASFENVLETRLVSACPHNWWTDDFFQAFLLRCSYYSLIRLAFDIHMRIRIYALSVALGSRQ
jgi:hypothetical protein